MATRHLFQITVNMPSPADLYQKHRTKISTAPSGSLLLRDLLMRSLREVMQKLRLRRLEEIPLGDANILHEMEQIIKALLEKIKRGEVDPHTRISFAVTNDPGPHKRMATFDLSRTRSRLKVSGHPPKDGSPGFLREKGRYAAARRARRQAQHIDHYTTGEFAQTTQGELLAVIDNSRINGEPGIDVRGTIIKPRTAIPYAIELGNGIKKRENGSDRIKLFSALNGMVRTRYDGEDNLRYIAVERDLRVDEVGFRAGGHVKARGKSDREQALDLDIAEFRTIPSAFETKTAGLIKVAEMVQGKVYGAEIVAEMVNQADDKYMVATSGPIIINRSIQKGSLYAPVIVLGNGRLTAIMMNARLHVRHRFTGHKILLSGKNRLLLGNDTLRTAGCGPDSCEFSGRNLFQHRRSLLANLAATRQQIKQLDEQFNRILMGHLQEKVADHQLPATHIVRHSLDAMSRLEQEYMHCSEEEEHDLRLKITTTLYDLGVENVLPMIRFLTEKKQRQEEQRQFAARLEKLTPPLIVKLELEECKEGGLLTIDCWEDQLRLKRTDDEIIIERPAKEEKLANLPLTRRTIFFNFDYESELLELQIGEKTEYGTAESADVNYG
ncbi:flagellar assembly protein A [Desulfurivibrio dismutans]|uniref:flagellar assembly protein A n=1 Tax=Desulfurivibrio dismutans TaxID=1398908 RepID=UPI0023DAB459|nr:flagellar assembly protein A [Desulfurivibrio alkaliphilus]MDF1614423.1 FapA family protein [Desulfurivibrio alkaliphilus]